MSKVSFEEIGTLMATFEAADGVTAGQVVKLSANCKVAPCQDGDSFCGAALSCREGCAGVQLRGFVTLSATGTVGLGRVKLCADGAGGVKAAATGGVEVLVVAADSTAKTCTVCL